MDNISNVINDCMLCGALPKLSCNPLKLGNCRILILGESPAKDGWIESGSAFYNTKGQLQATGKILEKLLNLCSLSIDDIYFTECCKCFISERKSLRKCLRNCKPILENQIAEIPCDIILPMGQYPTEAILGIKVNKMRDFVGKEFQKIIGNISRVVIPIYHTSPANPLCYKGNVEIFKKLNNKLKS